jgi:hypothetical protein
MAGDPSDPEPALPSPVFLEASWADQVAYPKVAVAV